MQSDNYIEILKQGLEKKIHILDDILTLNQSQKQLLNDPELNPDDFDENITSKAQLIEELVALDQGFEQVYARVREQLMDHKAEYKADIKLMQKYISQIMEKSNAIQVQERHNHELAAKKFSTVKQQIREVKSSTKAVNQYYSNMMKMNYVDPQFMDSKK